MQRSPETYRVAIVGSGPRGLSVMERLAAVLADANTAPDDLHIYLIDSHHVGTGRVWRVDQPAWYLMNTVADEVSAFSGPLDDGPPRPGAGPSLAQWWQANGADYPGPNSYAPRALHGRYMQYVMSTIETTLRTRAHLHKIHDTVVDLDDIGNGGAPHFRLTLATGSPLTVDRVVLVPGHSVPELTGSEAAYARFAETHAATGLRYVHGDSAADMPLDDIEPGSSVGVIGLGLSFYDVMAALTVGRGGHFTERNGEWRYHPSGLEPRIVGGSRSGMLLLARGRNQKDANHRYEPAIFTAERVKRIRERGPVDFAADVVPPLISEVNLVYYQTLIREQHGDAAAAAFRQAAVGRSLEQVDALRALAVQHGLSDTAPIHLDDIAHPFAGREFDSVQQFQAALLHALTTDLAHAEKGNVNSPVKAALDVIRDTRALIRSLVDFGGLTAESHRGIFLGWYVPRSSFLAAGPPRFRLHQAAALIKAGLLHIVGPDVRIDCADSAARYVLSSPKVGASAVQVTTLIDARIPTTNIALDRSPLVRQLLHKGLWTSFVNPHGDHVFDTGGVAVTSSPYHPLGAGHAPNRGLYVLGIPTEHTRWFMQAGSSRPGFWTDFVVDADAIARDALKPALERAKWAARAEGSGAPDAANIAHALSVGTDDREPVAAAG